MVAGASREVLFVLRPIPSEDAAAQFGRMVSLAEQANAKILQATEKASDEWAKAWASATERTVGGRVDAEQRALQRQVSSQEKALERQQREQEKAARTQEKAIERQAKEEERVRRQAEKEEEKRFKSQVAMLEAAAKAEKKRWEDEKKAREDAEETVRRTQEKALKDQEKAQRQAESALERQRSAAMAAKMSIAELGEGITRMGRGLATIGILGEESTEKLVRAFMRVQGVFDVVAGGLKVYKSLTVAVESYTKSVEAAAVAERALAAARGQSAAAGAAAGGAGAAGTAGAAGGLLGGAALPLAGAGAILAAGALSGRALWEGSHPTKDKDSWFTPDTTTSWALGGMGRLTALDPMGISGRTPYGGLVADRAANAESQAVYERMTAARERTATEAEAARKAEQDRQAQLSTLAALERQQQLRGVNVRPSLAGLMATGNQQRAALEATRPRFGDTDQQRGEYALAQAQLERELALAQQRAQAEAGLTGARQVYDIERGGFDQAKSEAAAAREAMGGATSRGASLVEMERLRATVEATTKAEEDAAARLAAANENRIRQEEQIAGIRQATAEAAIQSAQEEIALRESLIEKDRQRLMSAAERIASMTKAEQEQYGQLIQKARGGGELSAEEFRRLKTVSTEETEKLSREYAERMAAPLMNSLGIGDIERRRMADNEKLQQELRVRLEDQRKLSVDVQLDSEKIVREVSEEASKIIDAQMGRAIDEIKKNLEGSLGNAARQRNEAAQARAAVIR